jgi:hypothetical protein
LYYIPVLLETGEPNGLADVFAALRRNSRRNQRPGVVRALTDHTGTLLVTAEDEEIHLPAFKCGGKEVLAAHFTARVLERAGFGDHATLKALLTHGDELLAFRRTDGASAIYTHTRGSPPDVAAR